MDIYEFRNAITDDFCVKYRVHDCRTGKIIFETNDENDAEICLYNDYDIGSFDLYIDRDGKIVVEFNIETEEDE